ncbi:N-6 DNA methylase [Rhodococcus globerulus]|uniref:site-specific DNA-methyltransferase (adenine-specific) n=1 Tax=Rhodococcus globerulus TaxID=33008 RepID=A0ABU4BU86_RHOGO|nr:N-6 DNA methylase [Rhodococcus globerulus]MDV6267754.1 N-6 DNA methylase [Rhodococcus globerulus]
MTTPLVRAADIAAIANVSRAAVTQWRKRHKDFPAPKEAADSDSPLFDRAEVEQWLANRKPAHRNQPAGSAASALTPTMLTRRINDHLRGISGTHESIDLAGAGLVAEYLTRALSTGVELEGFASALSTATLPAGAHRPSTLIGIDGPELGTWLAFLGSASPKLALALAPFDSLPTETVNFLHTLSQGVKDLPLQEFLGVYDILIRDEHRGNVADPVELSQFLADLAAPALESGVVLDPAAGVGFTLLNVGENRDLSLVGVDINVATHATAVRRAILANRTVDLRVGNSLGDDPAAGVFADAVISTPPWGLRDFGPAVDLYAPRWVFGRPSPRSDGIWLQQAIEHLTDGGRAFIVTTRSELSRSGQPETLRHELLRQGAIEAIITLPTGIFAPYTHIATAIWVLARPGQTVDRDRVLLADVLTPRNSRQPPSFGETVEQYRQWRTNGTIRDTKQALLVPVRELLEPGVGLVPETWLQRRNAPTPQELLNQIHTAQQALADTRIPAIDVLPDFTPTTAIRREKLSKLPGVTIHRGAVLRDPTDTDSQSGIPILTGAVLSEYVKTGILEPTRFIDPELLRNAPLTQPGDIFVNGIGRIPARKIDIEGWAVASHAFLIRVDPTAAIDADYLVTCINAETRTQLSEVAGAPRMQLSKIDIPVIPLDDQRRISDVIDDLATTTAAVERHLTRLHDLARLVETAVGAGALTTS